MANRERGEVSLVVDGTAYVLRPTINAICEVEDLTGMTFTQLADRAGTGDIRSMRALLWAYLQDRHADEIKTPADAGRWVERAGGLPGVEAALRDVVALNAPEHERAARPREARVKGGAASILKRAESA